MAAPLFVLLVAGPVAAQQPGWQPGSVPPLPQIGLPLPPIGLPHPPTGLPAPQSDVGQHHARPPASHRRSYRQPLQYPAVFFVPTYLVAPVPGPEASLSECAGNNCDTSASAAAKYGRVRVEIQPAESAQVYLDGAYVGTAGAWEDLDVDPGMHVIEVRAEGYLPVQDSLLVTGGRVITYRSMLKAEARADPPQPPVAAPLVDRTPTTFYVIPGCYAGNVRPEEAGLPPTCDPKKAVTVIR